MILAFILLQFLRQVNLNMLIQIYKFLQTGNLQGKCVEHIWGCHPQQELSEDNVVRQSATKLK